MSRRPVAVGTVAVGTVAVALAALVTLVACARILGLRPAERGPFEHRAHVTRGISCLQCHAGVLTAGEEGPLHFPDDARCVECHEEPHDRRACGNCHGLPESRTGAILARRHLRFEHRTHVAELRGNCVACHQDVAHGDEGLRPEMASCIGCHEHRDEMEPARCERCHVDLPAERTLPRSHLVHEGDFLREHGVRAAGARSMCATCHTEQQCAGCHAAGVAPVTAERLAFDDPLRTGVHRAGFRARHAEEARADPGMCTSCHTAESCSDCHEERGVAAPREGSASLHPAGWLGAPGQRNDHGPAARRDPLVCASCHGGAGEALCIGCHRVGGIGGRPHPPGWQSRLERRTDRSCRPCHEVTR